MGTLIKLVLCDIDGTLLPFGHTSISTRTMSAIAELRDAGIEFGPASGREPVDLRSFFHGHASCYATGIMANGKMINVDGKRVKDISVDHAGIVRLVEYARSHDGCVVVYVPSVDENGIKTVDRQVVGVTEAEFERAVAQYEIAFDAHVTSEVPDVPIATVGYMHFGATSEMGALRDELSALCPQFDFVRPSPTFFDVLPHGWTKASALPILEEYLGIAREEVVFFGDSENDLAMMRAVPNSFAVSNGTDSARATARYHIGDAADDSVAKVLESLARNHGRLFIPEDALPRAPRA